MLPDAVIKLPPSVSAPLDLHNVAGNMPSSLMVSIDFNKFIENNGFECINPNLNVLNGGTSKLLVCLLNFKYEEKVFRS